MLLSTTLNCPKLLTRLLDDKAATKLQLSCPNLHVKSSLTEHRLEGTKGIERHTFQARPDKAIIMPIGIMRESNLQGNVISRC